MGPRLRPSMHTSSLRSASTSALACAFSKQSGGLMTMTLLCGPSMDVSMRWRSFSLEQSKDTSAVAGFRCSRSRTKSIPMNSPKPRTSPISRPARSCARVLRAAMRKSPTICALSRNPSRSMVSSTARPAAAQTGFPPNVLKYSGPIANASEMLRVATTAARGMPLPNGLPKVTISGTTFCCSKAHQLEPHLPRPVCTSSAMHTPPLARTAA
mmetsp:Transcript_22482/g.68528  ORF Transcript_22482/g.68528 Transcript_22482/m.68528 type:complete len:212 (-) Transcript_22482:731-1366(-)